jgi:DNA-binding XRE family transcriptional regulator
MNAPINIQTINGPDGKPAFVVMPYAEYIRVYQTDKELIPHDVVKNVVDGASPLRAWREHLNLTQAEMAARLNISQPSYAKQEKSENLRDSTLTKAAAALGITAEQLDI